MERAQRANPDVALTVEYSPDALEAAATRPSIFGNISKEWASSSLPVGLEEPVAAHWLLENIGSPNKPPMSNLALRK
jgi:hypothetical protein